MDYSRRQWLQRAGVVAAFTALGGQGALADLMRAPRLIPWRNWSGAQSCLPAARWRPRTSMNWYKW